MAEVFEPYQWLRKPGLISVFVIKPMLKAGFVSLLSSTVVTSH